VASWIEEHRLRCGPLTDAARFFSVQLGVEFDPPRGAHGLLALTRAIRRQLRKGPEDDRMFIELAGSYLGVLLCDALGEGRHEKREGRHGVCFRERAFFDAFAAIERALEADDVRLAIAEQVARAEAMARGELPADQVEAWASVEPRILPRLIGPRFFAELALEGVEQRLCALPLVAELQLCFVLRERERARFVRSEEPAGWRQSPSRLLAAALKNLARHSESARLLHCDSEQGAFVVAKTGDGLDAARLLLPGLHDMLARELGSPVIAAVPHRDALFACGVASRAREALRVRAQEEAARARHAISAQLFLVGPGARLSALP
jgi:hypothetical protein